MLQLCAVRDCERRLARGPWRMAVGAERPGRPARFRPRVRWRDRARRSGSRRAVSSVARRIDMYTRYEPAAARNTGRRRFSRSAKPVPRAYKRPTHPAPRGFDLYMIKILRYRARQTRPPVRSDRTHRGLRTTTQPQNSDQATTIHPTLSSTPKTASPPRTEHALSARTNADGDGHREPSAVGVSSLCTVVAGGAPTTATPRSRAPNRRSHLHLPAYVVHTAHEPTSYEPRVTPSARAVAPLASAASALPRAAPGGGRACGS